MKKYDSRPAVAAAFHSPIEGTTTVAYRSPTVAYHSLVAAAGGFVGSPIGPRSSSFVRTLGFRSSFLRLKLNRKYLGIRIIN